MRKAKYIKTIYSFSKILTYLNCPFRYKHIYMDGNKEKISEAMEYGIKIHKLCEQLCQLDNPEAVVNLMQSQGWDDKEIERGIKYAEYFIDKNIVEINGKKAIEFEYIYKVKRGVAIECHIDNIHYTKDGTLRILDIKSGGIYTKEQLENNLQLNLYAYIVSQLFPAVEIEIGIWNWQKGYNQFIKWQDNNILKRILNIIERIKQSEKEKKFDRVANEYCKYCEFFDKCRPIEINETYAYCKEMERFWKEKAERKAIELKNKLLTIGANKISEGDYEYYLIKKEYTKADVDDLITKINDLNFLKNYIKLNKEDIYKLKEQGIEIKEIPVRETEELRYKKILGE